MQHPPAVWRRKQRKISFVGCCAWLPVQLLGHCDDLESQPGSSPLYMPLPYVYYGIQLKSSPNPGAVVKAVYPYKIFSKELKASGTRLALTLFTLKVFSTASLEVDWGSREIASMGHSKLWYRESKGISVSGCLTEFNVGEMIHTEETIFFLDLYPLRFLRTWA